MKCPNGKVNQPATELKVIYKNSGLGYGQPTTNCLYLPFGKNRGLFTKIQWNTTFDSIGAIRLYPEDYIERFKAFSMINQEN
ncbi:MAG: hypothetical protein EA411_00565 [Saprospirales bacterium]|nr:MAG: hypothetical protein EA411_00565 [Saprospirales bacterium]